MINHKPLRKARVFYKDELAADLAEFKDEYVFQYASQLDQDQQKKFAAIIKDRLNRLGLSE